MKRGLHLGIPVIIALLFTSGCAKRETQVDRFYGTSYELAKQSQIHNPEAGIADGSALGLDGEIGKTVIDRYTKGFEKPAPKTDRYSVSFDGMKVK